MFRKRVFFFCCQIRVATFPWIARHEWHDIGLNKFKGLSRWYKEMVDRPAVQKGWQVPQNDQVIPMP